MIRTITVTLTKIPAIAFRQKLPSGGAGITILRAGVQQTGIASISKTDGQAIPSANTPVNIYPLEAFAEAIELTIGLPYTKRGQVHLTGLQLSVVEDVQAPAEQAEEDDVIIDSADYQRLVEMYTDSKGKLSYDLLNKDLIKTAHQSGQVKLMIEEKASLEEVREEIVSAKIKNITRDPTLTKPQIGEMIRLLDETDPKGVFRPLNDELIKWMRAA